jgi:hypothetical protein
VRLVGETLLFKFLEFDGSDELKGLTESGGGLRRFSPEKIKTVSVYRKVLLLS